MILYKDKECITKALCPMTFGNYNIISTPFYCDSSCAWCKKYDDYYICLGISVINSKLYIEKD